jgi:hypothetical protein
VCLEQAELLASQDELLQRVGRLVAIEHLVRGRDGVRVRVRVRARVRVRVRVGVRDGVRVRGRSSRSDRAPAAALSRHRRSPRSCGRAMQG